MLNEQLRCVQKTLEEQGEMFVDDAVVAVELARLHDRMDDLAALTTADRIVLERYSAVESRSVEQSTSAQSELRKSKQTS